jgi:rRNA processing protein Krr1/Pno1
MFIKAQTVIPAGTKITKVAASEGKGKNVYSLLRAEERKLENAAATKMKAGQFAAALKVGFTPEEALKLIKG